MDLRGDEGGGFVLVSQTDPSLWFAVDRVTFFSG